MLDRFEKFFGTVSEVHRYLHRIMSDEMRKHDIKGPYAVYFIALYHHGRLTVTELGEICERNKADVSRAVAALEAKGLAARHGNPNSGTYRAKISLTEKGLKAAKEMCERARSVVRLAGSGLNDETRAIFYSAFETIATNMKKISSGEPIGDESADGIEASAMRKDNL